MYTRKRRCDGVGGLSFADCRNQFAELHLELIQKTRTFFRTRTERIPAHLRNGQLEMSDLRIEIERACFSLLGPRIGRDQKRCQSSNICRQLSRIERHSGNNILLRAFLALPIHVLAQVARMTGVLSRDLWPVSFLWGAPVDPFKHVPELRR